MLLQFANEMAYWHTSGPVVLDRLARRARYVMSEGPLSRIAVLVFDCIDIKAC